MTAVIQIYSAYYATHQSPQQTKTEHLVIFILCKNKNKTGLGLFHNNNNKTTCDISMETRHDATSALDG